MRAKEKIADVLSSSYGSADLLEYFESDDEILFRLPSPIIDPQTAAFRSRAPVLNDLAISHRLSVPTARAKYGIANDFAFAIRSMETLSQDIAAAGDYCVSLRHEVVATRHGAITILRSTLVTSYAQEARTTATIFNILPPSLVTFVRRARHFLDFSEVQMSSRGAGFSAVGQDRYRYFPSENDRLSDGRRVDHVPALTLIELALWVRETACPEAEISNVQAEFLNYADPRLPFDIFLKRNQGAAEFVQEGQLVAIVRTRP